MSKVLFSILLLLVVLKAGAVEITRMEPAFWWVGMKNTELPNKS